MQYSGPPNSATPKASSICLSESSIATGSVAAGYGSLLIIDFSGKLLGTAFIDLAWKFRR